MLHIKISLNLDCLMYWFQTCKGLKMKTLQSIIYRFILNCSVRSFCIFLTWYNMQYFYKNPTKNKKNYSKKKSGCNNRKNYPVAIWTHTTSPGFMGSLYEKFHDWRCQGKTTMWQTISSYRCIVTLTYDIYSWMTISSVSRGIRV